MKFHPLLPLFILMLAIAQNGFSKTSPDLGKTAFHNAPNQNCDGDADCDGVPDYEDNCFLNANPDQADSDFDGAGDVCDSETDTDLDDDGVEDLFDNCVDVFNPSQSDFDLDGLGDACDEPECFDWDGDDVCDFDDNCPDDFNPFQEDTDGDFIGDACEGNLCGDEDGDDVCDFDDNCPFNFNPGQEDTDGDFIGDACEGTACDDEDGDDVCDLDDNCPLNFNPGQEDADLDGIGDACDCDVLGYPEVGIGVSPFFGGCSNTSNLLSASGEGVDYEWSTGATGTIIEIYAISTQTITLTITDGNGCSASASTTITICESASPQTWYSDFDADGFGFFNPEAEDENNTGFSFTGCCAPPTSIYGHAIPAWSLTNNDCNDVNNAVGAPKKWYVDTDGDGSGDASSTPTVNCTQPTGYVSNNNDNCISDPNKTAPGQCGCGNPDTDTDNDGVADCNDNCPTTPNPDQADANGNDIGDVCDCSTTVVLSATNASCFGSNNGTIFSASANGLPPYSYSWSTTPPKTTQNINLLAAGNYTVTVTDAEGCTVSATATIQQPPALTMSVLTTPTTATITANGGTPALTYNRSGMSNFQTSPVFTGLIPGTTYVFKTKDSKGCQKSVIKKTPLSMGNPEIENLMLEISGSGEEVSERAEIENLKTEIANHQSETQFAIFPNPASNLLNISFLNEEEISGEAIIVNQIGQQVLIQNLKVEPGEEGVLNVQQLPEGQYFLLFRNENGEASGEGFLKID